MFYTSKNNQNEEFFLQLNQDFFVPSFPIHHDVRVSEPTERYLENLKTFIAGVVPLAPHVFAGLTYYFDPTDTLCPGFFQLYRIGEIHYLYLLKIDLTYKPHEHEMIQRGTNDATAEYRSKKLFLDGIIIPIQNVDTVDNKVFSFFIRQTIDQTWIGETGRGYFVQGIWIDHELTKFFTKLLLPPKKRMYPYYPFQCRYRTVCYSVVNMSPEERKIGPPFLHRIIQFLEPAMGSIQDSLRQSDFSEDIPAFIALKKKIPVTWYDSWASLKVSPYLNEQDMKEFILENSS